MSNTDEILKNSQILDILQAQAYDPVKDYDIFMFLLGPKSNNCKFSEFSKWMQKADGNLARAITLFLGTGWDASVEKAVSDAKISQNQSSVLKKVKKHSVKLNF
jgi:hypothetical protein